jgi:hypothetical protein
VRESNEPSQIQKRLLTLITGSFVLTLGPIYKNPDMSCKKKKLLSNFNFDFRTFLWNICPTKTNQTSLHLLLKKKMKKNNYFKGLRALVNKAISVLLFSPANLKPVFLPIPTPYFIRR